MRRTDMFTRTNTLLRTQSGMALVVALIMMIVITLIALASNYTSIFEIMIAGNKRGSTDAFYRADAGINAITPYSTNFDLSKYTPLVANTSSKYNPFSDSTIPNPTSAVGTITYFLNQSGPPRGMGYSAINLGYAYYQIQSIGNDSAGTGSTATMQEEIIRLLPIQ
jgi:Tfp pilus assembly protein PilX